MYLAQLLPDIPSVGDIVDGIISALSGWIIGLLKFIIDAIAFVLPSTPEGSTLSGLLSSLVGTGGISFGAFFLYQAAFGISLIVFSVIVYKVIKLIPFI